MNAQSRENSGEAAAATAAAAPGGAATVRAIWPDELERVARMLPPAGAAGEFQRSWVWVLVPAGSERIVGAAALRERPGPSARLDLVVKPAWEDAPGARELAEAALAAAAELNLQQLDASLAPESPGAKHLESRGFVRGPEHEAWRVAPAEVFAEYGPVMRRGLLRRLPAAIAPIGPDDLASVRALCAHFGLLGAERVHLRPDDPRGFDPRFSFGFRRDGQVAAAVLCREAGPAVHLEVFARYADVVYRDSSAVAGLMFALLDACARRGVAELICTIRPAESPELIGLLKRGNGKRFKRQAGFAWRARA